MPRFYWVCGYLLPSALQKFQFFPKYLLIKFIERYRLKPLILLIFSPQCRFQGILFCVFVKLVIPELFGHPILSINPTGNWQMVEDGVYQYTVNGEVSSMARYR